MPITNMANQREGERCGRPCKGGGTTYGVFVTSYSSCWILKSSQRELSLRQKSRICGDGWDGLVVLY